MIARFEPAHYSIQDLHFLLEHLGKPPIVALRQPLEPGTHRNRLQEVLSTVHEHLQLAEAEANYKWAGVEILSESIARFLEWHDRSREIERRGVTDSNQRLISHPSMYAWEDGTAYRFAVGADSGELVRTEIAADGSRRPFGVTLALPGGQNLIPDISDVAPWVRQGTAEKHDDKVVDEKSDKNPRIGALRCTVCDRTEQYDPKNPPTRRAAMARMSKHLRTAKVNVNRHRILLTKYNRG